MTKASQFSLAIAFQVLVITVIIFFKFAIVTGGTEVVLAIRPVDPRDMLRGDYISFQYDISTINGSYLSYEPVAAGDTVYVSLGRAGRVWIVNKVSTKMPTDNSIFLKGFVQSVDSPYEGTGVKTGTYGTTLHVTYGLEQYFIPEGKGRNTTLGSNATAVLQVDDKGNGLVKQVLVNDKPWP